MPQATNLQIIKKSGTTNTYFAKWFFNPSSSGTTTNNIKVGDKVKVTVSGAKWSNTGTNVPSYVYNNTYTVSSISSSGMEVLLGPDQNGNNIYSWISASYLSKSTGGSGTVSNFDHFEYSWWYFYNGVWVKASSGTVSEGERTTGGYYYVSSEVTPDASATSVRFKVKPVSENKKVSTETDGKTTTTETPYWIGTEVTSSITLATTSTPPQVSTPTISSVPNSVLKIKMEVSGITGEGSNLVDIIEFQIMEVTTGTASPSYKIYKTVSSNLYYGSASHIVTLELDKTYSVHARAYNIRTGKKLYGEWSDMSSTFVTPPAPPKSITSLKMVNENDLRIEWTESKTADQYTIQYTTDKKYFDSAYSGTSGIVSIDITRDPVTNVLLHYATIAGSSSSQGSGIVRGFEYFFRVNAKKDGSDYVSAWSDIKSIILGKEPSPPTTWSTRSSAYYAEGSSEKITLYWQHNSSDGSSETWAKLKLHINDTETQVITKEHTKEEGKENDPGFYEIDTSDYKAGAKIDWKVKTKGIYGHNSSSDEGYSEYSMTRTINIYTPPSLTISLKNIDGDEITEVTELPIVLNIDYGPSTQTAINYTVSIVAMSDYETLDNVGNFKMVSKGDIIYSNYIVNTRTSGNPTMLYFDPSNITFENGQDYRIIVNSSMNTGLSAEEFIDFSVDWEDSVLEPNLDIIIDPETLSASLRPYCIDDNFEPVPNILLSVYRRNYDGTFTEIAENIQNTYTVSEGSGTTVTKNDSYVTDPHPALDYARYRVVAKDTYGKISYYDPVGVEVGEKSIVIQWDEAWSTYYTGPDGEVTENPPWSGSMIKLPYNIDVSEKRNLDISTVKYIGRKHPVSYFGTHTGETGSWSTEIPKTDTETLYALRRLSNYMGNVYVREPSGTGYWATISLSFGLKHKELTIPISIELVRVEGGM